MRVSTMRQIDCVRVAELITRAIERIGQDEAKPHLAYMTRPEHTPDYAYKYYNVRSRHFRLQEVFFVAHDGEYGRIDGVISFADLAHGKGYIRMLVKYSVYLLKEVFFLFVCQGLVADDVFFDFP